MPGKRYWFYLKAVAPIVATGGIAWFYCGKRAVSFGVNRRVRPAVLFSLACGCLDVETLMEEESPGVPAGFNKNDVLGLNGRIFYVKEEGERHNGAEF